MHQTILAMLHTSEKDMVRAIDESEIADFLTNVALDVCFTNQTVLKTVPGTAIFRRRVLII